MAWSFEDLWQFPHSLGAFARKHEALDSPPNSGGELYGKYKRFFNIFLMTLFDWDLNLVFVNVDRKSRMNDSAMWAAFRMRKAMEKEPSMVPHSELVRRPPQVAPCVIIGD